MSELGIAICLETYYYDGIFDFGFIDTVEQRQNCNDSIKKLSRENNVSFTFLLNFLCNTILEGVSEEARKEYVLTKPHEV